MDNKIPEPKISLINNLKYKLGYFQGKSKVVTTVVGVSLMAGVSMFVAYASLNRQSVTNDNIGAANPSCYLSLTLNKPTATPTPPACVATPVDIVLSIDRSGSIGGRTVNGKLSLTYEKEAAIAFVNTIAGQPTNIKTNVRIGVVDWAGNNYLVKSLAPTTNLASVINFINGISYLGSSVDDYTCIECSIKKSASLFNDSTRRRVVIMMSDGIANRLTSSCTGTSQGSCKDPTPPSCTFDNYLETHCLSADIAAIDAATVAKNTGIIFHVVGYGTNITPVTILEENLKAISSGVDYYHYGGSETNWSNVFSSIAPQICGDLSTPTQTPRATIKPTNTPTPAPISACTNWGVVETSGTGSRIVKIDSTLSKITPAKNNLCTSGLCEIESMDYDLNTKTLYAVPNVARVKGLYKVNTNSADSIADGTLTLFKAFSPAIDVNGLSFKKNDPTKVWLWRNGYGLYNMNLSTGATTLEYSSTNEVESIDWDNQGQYLYMSASSRANNYNPPYNMWVYDPLATTNKISILSSAMPGTTHSMDFAPANYLNGLLIAYNEKPGNNLYTYNVATKSVEVNYPALNVNLDAFAACIPN